MPKTLIEQLKKAIDSSGIKHIDIAKGAGLGRWTVSKFYNGKQGLDLESIEKLVKFLKLELTRKGK